MTGMLLCIHPFYLHAESLQEAMARAVKRHPMLQMAEQQIDVARGNLDEQRAYAYNPQLSLEPQRRRFNGGGGSSDYYITLSQGIETGGKRGFRTQSARAALNAANRSREALRQRLMIEAARACVALYFAEQGLDLRRRQRDMLERVRHAVDRKLALGESSQLDANLAQSAFASAQNAFMVAGEALTQARERYLVALGGGQSAGVAPELSLPDLDTDWRPPADAYRIALRSRRDLALLRAKQEQLHARAEQADAARIPDITLSAMAGREAGDQLIKLGLSVPLPILNSHRGAYQAALAEKARADVGLKWSERQLRYAVQSALDNHAQAMAALSGMIKTDMQRHAEETISLARKAYAAGELDLEDLVVHIRQGLDARMTALEMIKQGWLARIRLAEVLGHPEYILEGTKP